MSDTTLSLPYIILYYIILYYIILYNYLGEEAVEHVRHPARLHPAAHGRETHLRLSL